MGAVLALLTSLALQSLTPARVNNVYTHCFTAVACTGSVSVCDTSYQASYSVRITQLVTVKQYDIMHRVCATSCAMIRYRQ
jgi:hypothetical protein